MIGPGERVHRIAAAIAFTLMAGVGLVALSALVAGPDCFFVCGAVSWRSFGRWWRRLVVVIPGHPFVRLECSLFSVSQEFGQVIERIHTG